MTKLSSKKYNPLGGQQYDVCGIKFQGLTSFINRDLSLSVFLGSCKTPHPNPCVGIRVSITHGEVYFLIRYSMEEDPFNYIVYVLNYIVMRMNMVQSIA